MLLSFVRYNFPVPLSCILLNPYVVLKLASEDLFALISVFVTECNKLFNNSSSEHYRRSV